MDPSNEGKTKKINTNKTVGLSSLSHKSNYKNLA